MDIITDNKDVDVCVNGNIKLSNLEYPSIGYVGEETEIKYSALNIGGEDNIYAQIKLRDGSVLDRWEGIIGEGMAKEISHKIVFSEIGNKRLTISLGYIRG